MKKAIGYLRQSTQKQQSLEAQKAEIQRLANQHGFKDVIYFYDKNTGRNTNRTGYQQIVSLIKQGDCQILCCYRLNRLHRNLKNSIALMKLCQKYHVDLLSVQDGYFDTTNSFDCFKLNLFASLAESESDNISEQVKNGFKEKAHQGKLITTHAPFGFRYLNNSFVINHDEAATVREIFRLYIEGKGYKKISQLLESKKQFIKRKPYQVRNVLVNPNYCGRVINQYGRFDNKVPKIISENTFDTAHNIRKNKQTNRIPSQNLLQRKIKCPCCGSTLTNMTVRKQENNLRYYVCPSNMNEARFVCHFKGINAPILEEQVLNTCKQFFQTKQVHSKVEKVINTLLIKRKQSDKQNILNLDQLIDRLAKGKIDVESFKLQAHEIKMHCNSKLRVTDENLKSSFKKIITQQITLPKLYPYIDEINISDNKVLNGIYFKNEPLNIVNQLKNTKYKGELNDATI